MRERERELLFFFDKFCVFFPCFSNFARLSRSPYPVARSHRPGARLTVCVT